MYVGYSIHSKFIRLTLTGGNERGAHFAPLIRVISRYNKEYGIWQRSAF